MKLVKYRENVISSYLDNGGVHLFGEPARRIVQVHAVDGGVGRLRPDSSVAHPTGGRVQLRLRSKNS